MSSVLYHGSNKKYKTLKPTSKDRGYGTGKAGTLWATSDRKAAEQYAVKGNRKVQVRKVGYVHAVENSGFYDRTQHVGSKKSRMGQYKKHQYKTFKNSNPTVSTMYSHTSHKSHAGYWVKQNRKTGEVHQMKRAPIIRPGHEKYWAAGAVGAAGTAYGVHKYRQRKQADGMHAKHTAGFHKARASYG